MKPLAIPEAIRVSSRWVGLRARDPRPRRLPGLSPSGSVAGHSITYRGGSASASHRLPCSTERIFLRRHISNDFDEAAFDPRKNGNRSLGPREVNLPGVPVAQSSGVPAPREGITKQILTSRIKQIVDAKAQAEPALE